MPHVVTLSTVLPESVVWLWEPYIPRRKLTMVEGDPGMGKTWLMLQITAAISQGYGLPGREGTPQGKQGDGQPVLYLSAEDGLADTLRPRLDAAGADCTKIHALLGWRAHEGETVTTGSITLADVAVIQTAIATYRPALVIIDPLQAYLGAKTDMYRANEVRPLLAALVLLAEQYDCAIVCVRHLSKALQPRAIYRGLGSIDFTAAARSVILVGEEPSAEGAGGGTNASGAERRVLAHSKSSLAPKGASLVFELRDGQFSWRGQSPVTADDMAKGLQPRARRDAEVQKAEAWLSAYLRPGPRLAHEGYTTALALGISTRTLMRAKKALGVYSKKAGGIWYWLSPCASPGAVDTVGTVGTVGTLPS
jgi:RecA-family ATPase